jgi:hypothetical protein
LKDYSGDCIHFFCSICHHNVAVIWTWHPHNDFRILDQGSWVPKDEINGSRDLAIAVELTKCVYVQCVLVTVDSAIKECWTITFHVKCHRRASFMTRRVFKCNWLSNKIFA